MLADIVQATLTTCEGAVFDSCESCPSCGGHLSGYDVKKKQFAIIKEGEERKVIHVLVKRFRCRKCSQICFADQPFYPDTRIGSPVVDLCITLGETMHVPRISTSLAEMGIIVDRWTVRHYLQKNNHPVPSVDMFGFRVPHSIFSLSSLAMETQEGGRIDADRMLAACDYPSRKKNSEGTHTSEQASENDEACSNH
jgi:hypothetical protein